MKKFKVFKKGAACAAASALAFSLILSGCGNSATKAYSNSTVAAQVTAVSGNKVTVTLGELTEDTSQPSDNGQSGGTAPSGSAPSGSDSSTDSSQSGSTGSTPPAMPSGSTGSGSSTDNSQSGSTGSTPPAMPSGSSSSGSSTDSSQSSGTAPSGTAPSGDSSQSGGTAPSGTAPSGGMTRETFTAGTTSLTLDFSSVTISVEAMDGSTTTGSISDIATDSILEITFGDSGKITGVTVKRTGGADGQSAPDANGQQNNSSGSTDNGTAATTISEDTTVSGASYASTGDDENALRVDGATVSLDNIDVSKTAGSSSSTDTGNFYGMNAGLLAENGANVTIKNASVNTTTDNGNGVFSYGTGTTVNISDSTIRTSGNNAGGIQTTGGGTTNASNLDVITQGNSSAAIRSDRGGGTVNVSGGSYVSNGSGSPAVYSTAAIAVSDATLTANNSEAVVVEGKNSVNLTNCNVTGNMTGTYNDDSENIHNIMIYQSMSGDAEQGNASFSMTGGSLTAKQGDMIYVTNTSCDISLTNVDLTLANDTLLTAAGNSSSRGWGTAGSNGAAVTMTTSQQKLSGKITVDSISSLNLSLTNGTTYEGSINTDGAAGTVNVTLDSSSTWTLTGDSYVTSFDGNTANVVSNGYHLYVNGAAVL